MDLDVFNPTFLIQIEGRELSLDITQEITSFIFEDNEEELDVMELVVANRDLQFTDDLLFQEGNEVAAQFGYVGNLSPVKRAVIKEIDYDFPEDGVPTIRLKAYDKGYKLSGKENQKVWQKPAPGILYSEIAEEIAKANQLIPIVTPTVGYHLRVVQSNVSDAQFLKELAAKARDWDGDGVTGYMFYVQDDELHFHPRMIDQPPVLKLEYFTDPLGVLRSFKPSTQAQWGKGAGVETKAVGVDPRKKEPLEQKANNDTTAERTSLGNRTYLVDGNTGEGQFKEQETGRIVPSFERSEGFHDEPLQEPAKDVAEGTFKAAELQQVEATALTIGIPTLRAKQNIEISGVGQKFSGIYYCRSIRHTFGDSGYSCELSLRKNALGRGAGAKSDESKGRPND
jgi:phage protein D